MRFYAALILSLIVVSLAKSFAQPVSPDTAVTRMATVRSTSRSIDGAIVCPNIAMLAFVTTQVESGTLVNLSSVKCAMLPPGARVTIERDGPSPLIRGETMLGAAVRGVIDSDNIEADKP